MHRDENLNERYMEAAYAYTVGHFEEALAIFSELADAGNAMATTYLGQMYLQGDGTLPDIGKGLGLLQRAALLGDWNGAFSLGAFYRTGDCGVQKDPDKCKHFFRLAKELGCDLSVDQYL
jgi:TPR repeat protein